MPTYFADNTKLGSTISHLDEESLVVASEQHAFIGTDGITTQYYNGHSKVATVNQSSTIIENNESTIIVWLHRGQYLQGPKGDMGPMPNHQWNDTSLRFEYPNGTWGPSVELKGDKGDKGDQGPIGPSGQGIQGPQGEDGPTKYMWVKYADSVTPPPNEMYDISTGRIYVGLAYNRDLPENSGDPLEYDYTQYFWSKIQGTDGQDGNSIQGPQGPTGPAGVGFSWIGEYTQEDLNTLGNGTHPHTTKEPLNRPVEDGDTYLNIPLNQVFTYAGAWHTMLYSGGQGPIGPQGAIGGGLQYQGDYASSPSEALVNWAYLNTNDSFIYVYDGTSWNLLTSDGKPNTEGVDAGGGYRIHLTYHNSSVPPSAPIGDGTLGGWNPDPHSFPVGTITYCSQRLDGPDFTGAWNGPINITTHNFRGPIGFRGSTSIMVGVPNEDYIGWQDYIAEHAVNGAPQEWDIVTIYNLQYPEQQDTKRWALNVQANIWEWLDYNYVFLGDVLVDGTVDGNAFNAATTITAGLTANKRAYMSGQGAYRFWAGSDTPANAPFYVDENGNGRFTGSLVIGGEPINDRNELIGNSPKFIYQVLPKGSNAPVSPGNDHSYPPVGWLTSPPVSDPVTEEIWACQAFFNGLNVQQEDWSNSYLFGGTAGGDGDTIYPEYEYSVDGNAPWSLVFDSSHYFRRDRWVTNGIPSEWSTPARIRLDGNDGHTPVEGVDYFTKDGAYISWVYLAHTVKPINPSGGSFTGDPATEIMPVSPEGTWKNNPYYEEGKITYVSSIKYDHQPNTNIWLQIGDWSNSSEFSKKGDDGLDGDKGDKGDKGDTGDTGPIGPTGPKGETGSAGLEGDRGAGTFTSGIAGLSGWSNSAANAATTGGVPVLNDVVTLYNSSNVTTGYRETRIWNNTSWVGFNLYVHGNALITGTLEGNRLKSNTTVSAGTGNINDYAAMSGDTATIYGFWAGDTNPTNAEFSVTRAGHLKCTSADIKGKIEADELISEAYTQLYKRFADDPYWEIRNNNGDDNDWDTAVTFTFGSYVENRSCIINPITIENVHGDHYSQTYFRVLINGSENFRDQYRADGDSGTFITPMIALTLPRNRTNTVKVEFREYRGARPVIRKDWAISATAMPEIASGITGVE